MSLPSSLEQLSHAQWLTGPGLATELGISNQPTDVAVCGCYLYVSMFFGA